ncbi:MAG: glycosyltransferase family 2 protein [Chloroflexota bacterium]
MNEQPTRALRVLALIPAHDEAPRIAAVVRATAAHLPVLVVDDGSSDDTAGTARAAGAEVLEQRPNAGKGAALRAGFRRALQAGFDGVVTLDGDGQHDPAEIPLFLAAFVPGPTTGTAGGSLVGSPGRPDADAIVGSRPDLVVGRRDFSRMPPTRRLANMIGGRAFSWAVGTHVPDNQSGYRLIGRRLMEASLGSAERGFEFEVEILAACIAHGWPVAWVPIRTIYTGGPSHIRPAAHVRHFFRSVGAARRTVRQARRVPPA